MGNSVGAGRLLVGEPNEGAEVSAAGWSRKIGNGQCDVGVHSVTIGCHDQCSNHCLATSICWTLVMAPKSVTFRRHDHLVSVLFGDLLSHSYNITFSMFLYLVTVVFADFACHSYQHNILEMFLYLVHLLLH